MARRQKNIHLGGEQLLLIPPSSNWKRVKELPDLRRAGIIALDRETEDPGLQAGTGPSWPHKRGRIVGISVAWHEDNEIQACYLPTGHPDSDCFTDKQVAQWELDHQKAGISFVMQNAGYDIGFGSACWNLPVPKKIHDTSAMAYMIDEQRMSYSLNELCKWQGIPGKDETTLREAASAYGIDPKNGLYRLPARYVGDYATQDARATLMLADKFFPVLTEQDLTESYQLEMDLVPVVHQMMARGIRIDESVAQQLYDKFNLQSKAALIELSEKLNYTVSLDDIRQNDWLIKAHDSCKISYPRTAKGAASFTKSWMLSHAHWLPRLVQRARGRADAAEKFVKNYIMDHTYKGRLHASVHQYRAEVAGGEDDARGGGTRTYRFSYSNPPLQQMPKRDDETVEVRRVFLPEEGEQWVSADYSQQEYRLFVHYATKARLHRAADAAQRYIDNPKTDFHQWVADITGLPRKAAKDANFAKIYGAREKKFAMMIGKSIAEAASIMQQYDREMPFANLLFMMLEDLAKRRGYIKLLDGARCRFDYVHVLRRTGGHENNISFEPWQADCRRAEAERRVADPNDAWYQQRLYPSRTHKALNSLIQGSAARQTKMAMRACAQAGIPPLLQVHDELCFSVADRKIIPRISELMCGAAPLVVPMQVDAKVGASWGKLA
jgi:DNA polymerase I-like protein with 3'-5' exonuclease and polymerase domains